MKNILFSFLISVLFIFLFIPAGCKKQTTEPDEPLFHQSNDSVTVRKPNIYLYPQKTCSLSITLEFPLGGSVIQSIPQYANGWSVEVSTTGLINHQYEYLFYKSKTPDAYQYNSGWIVCRDTLSSFFTSNLHQVGFSQKETDDFLAYWIPLLKEYPYYIIYPQFKDDIEKVIHLNIFHKPDNVLRLFYVIKGMNDDDRNIVQPSIPNFERNGFIVSEWGVILM